MIFSSIWRFLIFALSGVLFFAMLAVGGGAALEVIASNLDERKYPPPGKLVDTGELSLHIDCKGVGGPTVLVDAGGGTWSTHWAHIREELAKDGRVCLYDRAGFGWSDAWPKKRTGRAYAEQIHSLMEAANEKPPFVFVGHSLGGYVARFYHDLYADELVGVVLVDSTHERQFDKMTYLSPTFETVGNDLSIVSAMARIGLFRLMEPPAVLTPLPDPKHQAIVNSMIKTPKFWKAFIYTFPSALWIAEELKGKGRLGDKTLLVLSAGRSVYSYCEAMGIECDLAQRDWNELQAELASLSLNSQQIVHPSSTHDIHIDGPAFLIKHISDFRSDIRKRE